MKKIYIFMLTFLTMFSSCADYLDVVPEGTATIEMAFNMRSEAIKYLYTCYSYMPKHGNPGSDPALLGGDELCSFINSGRMGDGAILLSQGNQSANTPLLDRWDHYYLALRDCNIFLENISRVPDMPTWEKDQWFAEVKVLKAYYHFCLVQMYGPVPVIRENLPIDTDVMAVKVVREPVDDCFNYIVQLLDEVTVNEVLPLQVPDPVFELGRITRTIAYALKAQVLLTAASPLYNGNSDQATLVNKDGTKLFDETYSEDKWNKALAACKEAIDICKEAELQLYTFPTSGMANMSETIKTQLSLRNAFAERWNSEIIWGNTQSISKGGNTGLQQLATAKLNAAYRDAPEIRSTICPTLKAAEMFYTINGVPISEDKTWDYSKRYELRTSTAKEKLFIKAGTTTARLHFDREPRFYADLGFDNGIWYGQGKTDESKDLFVVVAKKGNVDGQVGPGTGPLTGYWPKKLIHYTNVLSSITSYSVKEYPWPIMRLSDLYLMYAEAINEAEGPSGANSAEMFRYIDLVRERAGLKGVKESWDTYTANAKYNSKTGMRQIIQQERMIELAFEGSRFWDIRRWKTAPELYKQPVQGWDMSQSEAEFFYRPRVVYNQKFGIKDYFWPIKNNNILNNKNLVQNIGWK